MHGAYCIGDADGKMMLAHMALAQGISAIENICVANPTDGRLSRQAGRLFGCQRYHHWNRPSLVLLVYVTCDRGRQGNRMWWIYEYAIEG